MTVQRNSSPRNKIIIGLHRIFEGRYEGLSTLTAPFPNHNFPSQELDNIQPNNYLGSHIHST